MVFKPWADFFFAGDKYSGVEKIFKYYQFSGGGKTMGKRILIVDDAAFMRTMLKNIMEEAGYEVVGEAETGITAVEKYKELEPDLVLMDITMPEMDGVSAVREIIAYDSGARIIMCSAMGQKAMVVEAIEAGAKDFIVKPFQPSRVVEAIEKVCSQG